MMCPFYSDYCLNKQSGRGVWDLMEGKKKGDKEKVGRWGMAYKEVRR
jgi:hypothetical protein